ncbi:MAG: NUDIX hydrolase [Acidobacteria bacterium]|nr:NUDIX hydrolase [Acidobacteriota bacterium]
MLRTIREISAGGIVYKREKGQWRVALTARKGGKVWCLPKGLVEKKERLEETAVREVREETGLEASIARKLGDLKYWYARKENGQTVRIFKIVHFYLMRYLSGSIQDHDWEVDEVRWFPLDEAVEKLEYKNEKEIMEKARAALENEGG